MKTDLDDSELDKHQFCNGRYYAYRIASMEYNRSLGTKSSTVYIEKNKSVETMQNIAFSLQKSLQKLGFYVL